MCRSPRPPRSGGHAVRTLYLLSGATEVYTENGDPALLRAALAQWDDMVAGKLYLTGGPLVCCFEAADLSGADPSLTGVSVAAGARAREVAGVTVGGHEVVALTVPGPDRAAGRAGLAVPGQPRRSGRPGRGRRRADRHPVLRLGQPFPRRHARLDAAAVGGRPR
jgi:hypothetical protein